MRALVLDLGEAPSPWERRHSRDPAACRLADRHYSRGKVGSSQCAPPGRSLVFVTPCERAVWGTHWPYAEYAMDGLDAWRCFIFRNEGAGLSSELIVAAMRLTAELWTGRPADGWVTHVDPAQVASTNPGYCFQVAGWRVDHDWRPARGRQGRVRLRAPGP